MTFLTAVDIDDRPLARSQSVPGFLRKPSAGKGPCAPVEEKCKFLHEESNYYSKLPVKPGAAWLRGLLETKPVGQARLLLARFRVEIPRTLIFTRGQLFLLESRGDGHQKGVHVSTCRPQVLARPPGEKALDIQDMIKSEETSVGKPTAMRAGIPRVIDKRGASGTQNQGKVRIYDELQSIEFLAHEYSDDSAYLQDFVPVQERRRARVFRIAWRDQMAPFGYSLECRRTPAEVKDAGGDIFAQYCASQDHGHEAVRVDKLNPSALRHAYPLLFFFIALR
jgi:hypothetical protein